MDKGQILTFYSELGWNLVKVSGKQPVEANWTNLKYIHPRLWADWLTEGYNVGVLCGKASGLTVVDIDVEAIPEGLRRVLNRTLTQHTNKGHHYIYEYDPDIPSTRIDALKVDLLGGRSAGGNSTQRG